MILDLERLSYGSQQLSADEIIPVFDAFGSETVVRCHVDLDVRRAGDTFQIHAQLEGHFSTPCHRCLEATDQRVRPSFDIVVQRGAPGDAGQTDDLLFIPAEQRELSLDQQIYESLVVGIPMRITCMEDCKGLCPRCGANLNTETCDCAEENDPRWDALRRLSSRLKSE